MKKLFLIAILLSSSSFAADLDLNVNATPQNCQDGQKLLVDNTPAPCCIQHKGVCGCGPDGAVCCDGSGAPGCPCDEPTKKK